MKKMIQEITSSLKLSDVVICVIAAIATVVILFIVVNFFNELLPDPGSWESFGNIGDGLNGTIGLIASIVGIVYVVINFKQQRKINVDQEETNKKIDEQSTLSSYVLYVPQYSNTIRQDILNLRLSNLGSWEDSVKFYLLNHAGSTTGIKQIVRIVNSVDYLIEDIAKLKIPNNSRKLLRSFMNNVIIGDFCDILIVELAHKTGNPALADLKSKAQNIRDSFTQ